MRKHQSLIGIKEVSVTFEEWYNKRIYNIVTLDSLTEMLRSAWFTVDGWDSKRSYESATVDQLLKELLLAAWNAAREEVGS